MLITDIGSALFELRSTEAFLLTNLNPDFAVENLISRSIYSQTNLRLYTEQSASDGGLFHS